MVVALVQAARDALTRGPPTTGRIDHLNSSSSATTRTTSSSSKHTSSGYTQEQVDTAMAYVEREVALHWQATAQPEPMAVLMPEAVLVAGVCAGEQVTDLYSTPGPGSGLRVERIVSTGGHATPPGQWYDQAQAEWVAVVQGEGVVRFELPLGQGESVQPRVTTNGVLVPVPVPTHDLHGGGEGHCRWAELAMGAGVWVDIPAHCRHRVERTSPAPVHTVWVALFR